ncbi:MAG: cytidine deaminase [Lachnospiraceae bacterium]|nr:cytidine deaminase [Lachnospiraceae bacterium]
MKYQDLIAEAMKAKEFAYAPYSHFRVGAALLTESGRIYTGCNVENASFSATNCAERTAVFTAVAQGEKEFRAIAVNGDTENYLPPCGVCRQVLAEFCDLETFQVILANNEQDYRVVTLAQLLPGAFQSKDLVVNDTNKSTVVD